MNLIPANEDVVEKSIEDIGTNTLAKFDTSKLTVNPLFCDVSLLPHLALSLDVSIVGLDETEARTYLQNAREIKKYIGSKYAVNKAASSIFGDKVKVEPWDAFKGVRGTYRVVVDVGSEKLNDENIAKCLKLVTDVKRKSTHFTNVVLQNKAEVITSTAFVLLEKESIEVRPKILNDIEQTLAASFKTRVQLIEQIQIQPMGA